MAHERITVGLRVVVSRHFPFDATDPKTGESFECHCVVMGDTLIVSPELEAKLRQEVPAA